MEDNPLRRPNQILALSASGLRALLPLLYCAVPHCPHVLGPEVFLAKDLLHALLCKPRMQALCF